MLAVIAHQSAGILNEGPRELREGLAADNLHVNALSHHAEAVLLRVDHIKDAVAHNEEGEEEDPDGSGVGTDGGNGLDEEGLEAVDERDAGKVPEDKHPSKLLIVDIPGGDNALLALLAGVRVEEVGEDDEPHVDGDVAKVLVLLSGAAGGEDEQEDPRVADLSEHLQINAAGKARVEGGAHEEIVDDVARHADLVTIHVTAGEDNDRGDIGPDDSAGHVAAKLLTDEVKREDASVVKTGEDGQDAIPSVNAVALVRVVVPILGGNAETIGDRAGEDDSEDVLDELEDGEDSEGELGGASGLERLHRHLVHRGALEGLVAGVDDDAIVEFNAGPEVVHDEVAEEHDAEGAHCTAKSAEGAAKLIAAVPHIALGGELLNGSIRLRVNLTNGKITAALGSLLREGSRLLSGLLLLGGGLLGGGRLLSGGLLGGRRALGGGGLLLGSRGALRRRGALRGRGTLGGHLYSRYRPKRQLRCIPLIWCLALNLFDLPSQTRQNPPCEWVLFAGYFSRLARHKESRGPFPRAGGGDNQRIKIYMETIRESVS